MSSLWGEITGISGHTGGLFQRLAAITKRN